MNELVRNVLMGAAGAAGDSTFVDDVFSTYLYKGTNGANTVNTGLNMSEEGGLLWIKARSNRNHQFFDTERGVNKVLSTSTTDAEITVSGFNQTFTTTGFTLNNSYTDLNDSNVEYASWNFRKAKGFFDIVTYTGNGSGSARTINHNLGSVPGFIALKKYSQSSSWVAYHRDLSTNGYLTLNSTVQAQTSANGSINSATSTQFTVGVDFNDNNQTYVAYIWAGGESTAATATSCKFLGTSASGNYDNNKINVGTTSGTKTADLVYGTGDFTMEAWVKCESSSNIYRRVFNHGQEWGNGTHVSLSWDNNSYQNKFSFWSYNLNSSVPLVASATHSFDDDGQWHHVAVSRQSGTFRIFVDGILEGTNSSYSGSLESVSTNYLTIGATHNANVQECFKGNISNLRIVKGTAVYTSSFKPSYEPLTNITNTKLLCLNGSSVTSATVTPITLTVGDSSVTASTDSPFDDPEGFKFGEGGDQNIIKCGSYTTDSNEDANVYLGFEPQWVLVKRRDSSTGGDWLIYDSMRGFLGTAGQGGGGSLSLSPNNNSSENDNNRLKITSTGFYADDYGANRSYIYIALRRPDGYVGKPAEVGTDVFAMDTGNSSSTQSFTSGFPVDFATLREPASAANWDTTGRLIQGKYVRTNTNDAVASYSNFVFDQNNGFGNNSGYGSSHQAWMWKRHAGFEFQVYNGVSGTSSRPHSMNAVPEMIWAKRTIYSENWVVYHKGLNGGTNPHQYYLTLNSSDAEVNANQWNAQPTSTHWFTAAGGLNNNADQPYISMLFASVDGISKVGSYTGTGVSGNTITVGFTPRFVIIKNTSRTSTSWAVLDTVRGWGSGDDKSLELNDTQAQETYNYGAPTSTGFTLEETGIWTNYANDNYIYYAHA